MLTAKASCNFGSQTSKRLSVYAKPGSGQITVNDKAIDVYFGRKTDEMVARSPLELVELADKFDINVTVKGSGPSGQAEKIITALKVMFL
jgi:small subunit ribosomal protein S9